MGRWYPLHERDPERTKDPKKKAKIYEAKLIHEIGGEPTTSQLMLIRSLVPLFLESERLRGYQERTGAMNKRYPGLQAQIANTMGQLRNSTKPASKRKTANGTNEEAPEDTGLDLGAVLHAYE